MAAGRAHLLVLTDREGVFTLGNNAYGQCGRQIVEEEKYSGSRIIHNIPHLNGAKIKSIECGQDHRYHCQFDILIMRYSDMKLKELYKNYHI